jgi:hypothetical protein
MVKVKTLPLKNVPGTQNGESADMCWSGYSHEHGRDEKSSEGSLLGLGTR